MTLPEWLRAPIAPIFTEALAQAEDRQVSLTKPPGSLGQLEHIAVRLAAMQGVQHPRLDRVKISVFASDHGVAASGVSAFPQSVTAEMVRNFSRGGAAINVLANQLGAELEVINLGTLEALEVLPGVLDRRIASGTQSFFSGAAMQGEQLVAALDEGRGAVERGAGETQCFIGGEMGIGNTTSASALACAILECDAATLCGPGTGLDAEGVAKKAVMVNRALDQWEGGDAMNALAYFGGFEIAALVGAYIRCAQLGIPVLVDGFITGAAALVAVRSNPEVSHWMFFSHCSAEPGHRLLLGSMQAEPLLNLGMRLGEASGAAVALPILRAAAALHGEMATFAEAGVSQA